MLHVGEECVEQVELVEDDDDVETMQDGQSNPVDHSQAGFRTPDAQGGGLGTYDVGQSSRQPQDGDHVSDSEDEDYDPDDESETESVASLDHLSEGEEELEQVRRGNPIARIPTNKELPKFGGSNQTGTGGRSVIHEEHDEFIKKLVNALKGDPDEEWVDPLEPPPENIPTFPIHDKDTHWRLKQPRVSYPC